VAVAIIEADKQLAANREVASAAARELATEPEITAGGDRQAAALVSVQLPYARGMMPRNVLDGLCGTTAMRAPHAVAAGLEVQGGHAEPLCHLPHRA
jgi:hypothetical protein